MAARYLLLAGLLGASVAFAWQAAPEPPAEEAIAEPAPAEPAEPAADDGAPVKLSDAVLEMLAAKDDDDKPIFDESEARAYLESMPGHVIETLHAKIDEQWIAGPRQLHTLLSVGLQPQALEIALQDNCILCHTDPDSQEKRTLFTALEDGSGRFSFRELAADVHFRRGLSCAGCHGGSPEGTDHTDDMLALWPPSRADRKKDRAWIPGFCGRCHADSSLMRRFNPSLPTDQLAKYKESLHGQLLLEKGDSKAAQCVSCHGVHGIRGPDSPLSSVHARRIPETCGHCHADAEYMAGYLDLHGNPLPTDQLEKFKASVHGKALLEEGDIGAPACNDCHGSHSALPPEVASVAQVCRNCHLSQGTLFDGSPHKKAFAKNDWPECGQCHGNHDIEAPDDTWIGDTPGTVCHDCHAENSKDNPDCDRTAAHFKRELVMLVSGHQDLAHVASELREKGLDTEEIDQVGVDLEEAVLQARTRIHSFDRSTFDQAAKTGHGFVAKGGELVAAAHEEYRFRVKGLSISVAVMVLLAVAIYLRLRAYEAGA